MKIIISGLYLALSLVEQAVATGSIRGNHNEVAVLDDLEESFFRDLAVEDGMMSMPTDAPSSLADTVCADEETATFSNTLVFDFEGPPGFGSDPDNIAQLEDALLQAYNAVAMCDQAGAFITATSVLVDTGANDDIASLDDSGLGDFRQFTWIVDFQGECRGCPAGEEPLFLREDDGDSSGDESQCFCSFPTTDAYVAECNNIISAAFSGVSVRGITTTTRIQLGSGGLPPSSTFTTSYTLTGFAGSFGTGGGSFDFNFNLIGRAFIATYNSLSFFSTSTCDAEERVLVTAVPVSPPDDIDDDEGGAFSVVFNIQGTCRGCGSATVVFGDHDVDSLDITATCPVGAQLRCPSLDEFLSSYQDTLDRLEGAGLLPDVNIDNIVEADGSRTNSPVQSPTLMPSPTTPPPDIATLLICTGQLATSWGDPHMITFDNLRYDCQGEGEFVLTRAVDLEVRAIFVGVTSQPVSVARAVATSERDDAPVFEIKVGSLSSSSTTESIGSCPVDFLVDGERQAILGTPLEIENVATVTAFPSAQTVQIVYPRTGLIVTVEVIQSGTFGCYVNAYVCIDQSITDVLGLLGSPTDNTGDDWMDQSGNPLAIDFTQLLTRAAYEYCTTNWCIRDPDDSLFTYADADADDTSPSFADTEKCDASYPGAVDTSGASDELRAICNGNQQCLIEGLVGTIEDAEAAIRIDDLLGSLPQPTASPTPLPILLYENDFETLNVEFVPFGSCLFGPQTVNNLYGTPGNPFSQTNTVETLRIAGNVWRLDGSPYQDPDGRSGDYSIGMLSTLNDDRLALQFDSQGKQYVNVMMDISSIDNICGDGPFGIDDPIFRVRAIDSPGGQALLTGTVLDSADMTGPVGPNPYTYLWTTGEVALDVSASTNGKISITWDLIQSGYGAFDNLVVTASDARCNDGTCASDGLQSSEVRASCLAHKDAGMDTDGLYLIQPTASSTEPFIVYCNQNLRGGGWALFAHIVNRSPVADIGNPVLPRRLGVVTDEAWVALRDGMERGMLFEDENGAVSIVTRPNLEQANCWTPWDLTSLDLSLNPGPLDYLFSIFHDENNGCLGARDYCIVSMRRYDTFPNSDTKLFQYCRSDFYEEWGYGNLQFTFAHQELSYYVR